jgi:hypothetical protein
MGVLCPAINSLKGMYCSDFRRASLDTKAPESVSFTITFRADDEGPMQLAIAW